MLIRALALIANYLLSILVFVAVLLQVRYLIEYIVRTLPLPFDYVLIYLGWWVLARAVIAIKARDRHALFALSTIWRATKIIGYLGIVQGIFAAIDRWLIPGDEPLWDPMIFLGVLIPFLILNFLYGISIFCFFPWGRKRDSRAPVQEGNPT